MSAGAGDISDGRTLRPLAGILGALAVSLTGTRVSAIALPWFVLMTTGSATQTGLVAFCEMTPYVVAKALAGPLVDRTGPRVVSWATDLVSSAAAVAVPVCHGLGLLSLPLLLALVAVIGTARGPGDLAKRVMVPDAAERGGVPLERAMGLSGVIDRLASTVGPAAGGALIMLVGPLTGLFVNAACFALGSLLVAVALPRGMGRPAPAQDGPGDEGSYRQRFAAGFAFLRGDRLLLSLVVMVTITNLLDAAFNAVLVPVWAKESGHGPAAIGLLAGAGSAAAVAGSLLATVLAHRLPRRAVLLGGFLVLGAPRFVALASGASLGTLVAVFVVAGFGAGFLNPILGAVSVERVPRPLLGRVQALADSLAWSGIPLGGLLAGSAVALAGLTPVLLVCGAVYFLTTNLTGLRPEWAEMDRARAHEERAGSSRPVPHP
ncbi:MFS transporter [Streptomyces sp. TRM66268-LWL]|uniref:MFS transporter n=1 Tax=Streptomyces polyasparticus TaxID=2767826 RepID=A0ABR7SRH9_9ACTN|nr:MFS transporter [Streptomyces polyasparticus]MBC9718115.1 MFS transporter [Streptomyces polyasparticus]